MKSSHPWFIDTRSTWDGTLRTNSDLLSIDSVQKDYESKTGQSLVGDEIRDNATLTPHHLISCNVTKSIYSHWKKIIEEHIGYNVNCAENLLVLPNVADVSCYLSVPLHEGNHNDVPSITAGEFNDYAKASIKDMPVWNAKIATNTKIRGYHSKVFKLLTKVLIKYFKECNDIDEIKFINDMNKLSLIILRQIKNGTLTISKHGEDYLPTNMAGCRNVRGISSLLPAGNEKSEYNKDVNQVCKLERNHEYLENLFEMSGLDKKVRKKIGFVVSSKLTY